MSVDQQSPIKADQSNTCHPNTSQPNVQNVCTSNTADAAEAGKGFKFFSYTRQLGSWLTSITEGEKIEVSKKDLNAIAPVSF